MKTPGRRSLQNRIFLWFAAAIALTAALSFGVIRLTSPAMRPGERLRLAAARHIGRVWNHSLERSTFIHELASDLEQPIQVYDNKNLLVDRDGGTCEHEVNRTPVVVGDETLGVLVLCRSSAEYLPFWRNFINLSIAILMLWAVAGRIARRLARPLADVATVAQRIGESDLQARVAIGHQHIGEIEVLARSVNDMADRIGKQLEDQKELLATVSHEMRTPLGHMRLLVEMARDGAPLERMLNDLDGELDDSDHLVGQLTAGARLDFTALQVQLVDPTELCIRALERMGIEPSVLQVDSPGIKVRADPTLLMRALTNLLDNARKHGKEVVVLRISGQGDAVRLEVDDAGPGFAPGMETRAFDRFERGGSHGASLGLGLHLVKRIAEAHQGHVFAQNLPQGGARVGLTLPWAATDGGPASSRV